MGNNNAQIVADFTELITKGIAADELSHKLRQAYHELAQYAIKDSNNCGSDYMADLLYYIYELELILGQKEK